MNVDPKRTRLILAPAVVVAIVIAAWKAGAAFTEFRAELNLNFARLEAAVSSTKAQLEADIAKRTADRWTSLEMKDWSYQLERGNRDVLRKGDRTGIVVPVIGAPVADGRELRQD